MYTSHERKELRWDYLMAFDIKKRSKKRNPIAQQIKQQWTIVLTTHYWLMKI
ncbi:hypothetical protein HMPREF3190_00768 [Umbribacter vaginalis]|nr:hypothetical protein HMPREF3190_00768 [Coriobacteriales bacterium DNF00809]